MFNFWLILYIIDWLLFIITAGTVLYLGIFSIASLFTKNSVISNAKTIRRFIVLIPSYEPTKDFIDYGYIPELMGRLPVIIELEELTTSELVSVLTEPRNSLVSQYRLLFERAGTDLTFRDDALTAIAKSAKSLGIGARGLSLIMRRLSDDLMFETHGKKVADSIEVTREYVEEHIREM